MRRIFSAPATRRCGTTLNKTRIAAALALLIGGAFVFVPSSESANEPATSTAAARDAARQLTKKLAAEPQASVQELMADLIDPAADAVWEAVSSETGPNGIEEHYPRTAEEWNAVRRHALRIVEGANLLLVEGRQVSHGKALEDADVPGISTAPQIQHAIDTNRAAFGAYARELHAAGSEVLAATVARNPQRLLAAGAKLDAACERCHAAYWYPNAEQQPAWPAPLTR